MEIARTNPGGTNTATLTRLPKYLAYLKIKQKQGVTAISSTRIANDLRLTPILVRKDLATVSQAGRPKTGYPMDALIGDLERFLGCENARDAFLVGAGRLGRALMGYGQFQDYGLTILAAFDTDEALHGREFDGKPVLPVEKLPDLVRRMQVHLAILAVPDSAAQATADLLVQSGVRAIWNFTTETIAVPDNVLVQHENLAASLAILSKRLAALFDREKQGGTQP